MFFFKQKTAYELRISDWSSDVCSSDLRLPRKTISPYVIRTKGDELNLGKCRRDHHDEIRIRLAHRHKPASRCIQKLPCLTAAGRQAPVVLEPVPRNPLQLLCVLQISWISPVGDKKVDRKTTRLKY